MPDPTQGIPASAAPPPQPIPQPFPVDLENPIIVLPNDLTVRHHRHSDAAALSHHADNPKIARNMRMRWPVPYDVDRAHDWIARNRNEANWQATGPASTAPPPNSTTPRGTVGTGPKLPTAWVICQSDVPIGGMGVEFQTDVSSRTIPVGYWIGEEYWGRGIMSRVLPAFVDWLWRAYPWLVKLEISVYGWNPGSARVLEKCGFELEGRLRCNFIRHGVIGDTLIYGLIREGINPRGSDVPPEPESEG